MGPSRDRERQEKAELTGKGEFYSLSDGKS